jgi:Asp-tRNA(Asn)/Glu-tRNA(Gln) amidotransferase C subunit
MVMELSTQKLERICKELNEIVKFENSLHMMDMTLNQTDVNTLEEVISMIEDIVNYDPTPYYLYDNSGGEAPMTANERLSAAWKEHLQLHS